MYYDASKIDSYRCPVKIIVSRRGLGKTFHYVKLFTERFITKGERFIYVVETGEMVDELAKNNGEKFWASLINYYKEQDTSRKRYFYNKLTELIITEDEAENQVMVKAKLVGGTIKINGETAGYLLDMNSFGEIKRNNFPNVRNILIDEFITEKLDKTALDNPRKIASIIQSVGRLKDINLILLGNAIRFDDPILSRMGFKLNKYGFYKQYDNHGLFAVLHFVDPADYPEFAEAHDKSVAGRFSKMLGETNEEENKFKSDLPEDRRLVLPIKYKKGGYILNVVKEDVAVSIKELEVGGYACVPFNGRATMLYCMTEKEQGFLRGYRVICNKVLKQSLLNMIKANIIFYYSEVEYTKLKFIVKGD